MPNHGFITGDAIYYVSKSERDQVTDNITYTLTPGGQEFELDDEKGSALAFISDPSYGVIRLDDDYFQIALRSEEHTSELQSH